MQAAAAAEYDPLNHIDEPKLIAAVDTAYGFAGKFVYAGAVITSFPDIELIERVRAHAVVEFPYVPGLLFYREGAAILKALSELQERPDVIIVHGHGSAHPTGFGMASQIGVLADVPTVGCCRRMLAGNHRPVGTAKGSSQPIVIGEKTVGLAYRSKANVKPIFISAGHKCDLDHARDIVARNLRGYRLPEPLRLAHLFANKYKKYKESNRNSR